MDTDYSNLFSRPAPQQSGSAKKTARMPTPSAPPNATAAGAEPLNTPTQQPHRAPADGTGAEHTNAHDDVPASSNLMSLPFRDGPVTANTQVQSDQANSGILRSDVYLSARKLLANTEEHDAHQCSPISLAADATVAHSHFSELLTRLVSDISAGGHDDLLSEVMLPGLAHLVGLIEETCSTPTKATHSTTGRTTASPDTTTFTFRSHPASSSAFSTPVPIATPNPADTVQEITSTTANPKTFTLAFRSHQNDASASSTLISSAISQPFQFPSLPHDVKIRVLSFVPESDVALNFRLVCHEFCDLVDGNELHITNLTAERECSRLQSQIDVRKQMMPRNLTDFVFDASRWVQLRGFCPSDPKVTINSFTAWRLSADGNRDMQMRGYNVQPRDLSMWGILTTNLLRLQLDLQRDEDALGERLIATLQDYAVPSSAACNTDTLLEYQRLCFMLWDHPVSEPFFSGEQHDHSDGEKGTFPELRLSTASYRHLPRSRRSLDPDFPTHDVQELGLPELKDKTFFYYFGEEVDRDVFERLYPLTPLKRASLLKKVKLF